MMMITTITIIALFLASPSSSQLIKGQYKWDEDVQFCSFSLHIFFNLVCGNRFNDKELEGFRSKHNLRDYEDLNMDCCEHTCTPLHILKHYCISSKNVDITKDLILFPIMQQIGYTAPINTSSVEHTGNITLTTLMYCYMGFKQYCYAGSQQAILDMINKIRQLKTSER